MELGPGETVTLELTLDPQPQYDIGVSTPVVPVTTGDGTRTRHVVDPTIPGLLGASDELVESIAAR